MFHSFGIYAIVSLSYIHTYVFDSIHRCLNQIFAWNANKNTLHHFLSHVYVDNVLDCTYSSVIVVRNERNCRYNQRALVNTVDSIFLHEFLKRLNLMSSIAFQDVYLLMEFRNFLMPLSGLRNCMRSHTMSCKVLQNASNTFSNKIESNNIISNHLGKWWRSEVFYLLFIILKESFIITILKFNFVQLLVFFLFSINNTSVISELASHYNNQTILYLRS